MEYEKRKENLLIPKYRHSLISVLGDLIVDSAMSNAESGKIAPGYGSKTVTVAVFQILSNTMRIYIKKACTRVSNTRNQHPC